MTRILLAEDDKAISHVLTTALNAEGWDVDVVKRRDRRNESLKSGDYSLLITDVLLEDGDGLDDLGEWLQQETLDLPVIVMSAQNTLDTALRASNADAFEYFPKPFDLEALIIAAQKAVTPGKRLSEDDSGIASGSMAIVGRSAAMQEVYRTIGKVLKNDLSVLLLGESGTGKELVAETIHNAGHRNAGPFVPVNVAAIPSELIESVLFGHEKGAFTGAVDRQIGMFEQANGGTLFLDEIGDMSMAAQTRLLRALQSGRINRIGGREEIGINARIIAATHQDFEELIASGKFREDLYYRINVLPITLPALRDRREDIPDLVRHFASQAVSEGLEEKYFADEAMALLQSLDWRGNVRELRNSVMRIVALSSGETITRPMVAQQLGNSTAEESNGSDSALFTSAVDAFLQQASIDGGALYAEALEKMEKPLLQRVMMQTDHNQIKAAELLGINRNTLRKKLKLYDMLP
ncbi:sigma-54-dependent transcriptional regulator [Alterisphingorhabdus coralli]|uniref:DNA-binding transcriptional regulator NtrC n=1 Tax=Alterisphingorhabdus coralli TaxID=3071408 RepID=A0AA97F497_9SPHN|nr:sigma-54 dependent transcriptional regulator [Parasphingorhabdus sp. SCSIO 66989]WOE74054.1 sigma-54 dependent transcriptional regulator [Parasphingorhabdus sp. SCSIO 66989]